MKQGAPRTGFTLIELMLVVAIIGLLAAIALPKFANLVIKAREAAVKGALGAVRSALSIYYADNDGMYPISSVLPGALTGKYISAMPDVRHPTQFDTHASGNYIEVGTSVSDPIWTLLSPAAWYIEAINPGVPATGKITVNCTHTDSKGTTWSLW